MIVVIAEKLYRELFDQLGAPSGESDEGKGDHVTRYSDKTGFDEGDKADNVADEPRLLAQQPRAGVSVAAEKSPGRAAAVFAAEPRLAAQQMRAVVLLAVERSPGSEALEPVLAHEVHKLAAVEQQVFAAAVVWDISRFTGPHIC